jgi:GT2 family glycosyltransferase/tetratricopeptide (TPR) repeat protein
MPNSVVELPRSRLRRRRVDVILLADRARDARQWERAAELYREALDRHPRNAPIWVQYGHALKESGGLRDPDKLAQAEVAYRRALSLNPSMADTHLQLGHILKIQGKAGEAEASYLRAFALDPSMPDPLHELGGLGWSVAEVSELRTMVRPVVAKVLDPDLPNGSGAAVHQAPLSAEAAPAGEVLRSGDELLAAPKVSKQDLRAFAKRTITMNDLRDKGAIEQARLLFDVDFIYGRYNIRYENSDLAMSAYFSLKRRDRFDPSSYFLRDIYIHMHPDLRAYDVDPLEHYLYFGRSEHRSPHPLFNTSLAIHADTATTHDDIYFRFLSGKCDFYFHELLDLQYIRSQQPTLGSALEIFRASSNPDVPLVFAPHPLFDPEFYKAHAGSQVYRNELIDFILHEDRCIMTHPLFDPVYYVQTSGISRDQGPPLLHYLRNSEAMPGEVSPFVDIKFLNHQVHIFLDDTSRPPIDPLSYALTHRVDADTLLHPHIDTRIIDRAFRNQFDDVRAFRNQFDDVAGTGHLIPQAQQVAQVMRNFLTSTAEPPKGESPLFSVVILNYHKHVYTFFAVLAVLNSFGREEVEIIVVENGGELFYYEAMKRYFASTANVKLMKMQEEKYFGEGCNIGADQAKGKYILYLNNDCFLSPDYAQHARRFLSDRPDAHAVGALLLFPDGTIQEFGGLVSDCGTVIQRGKGVQLDYLASRDVPERVDYVSAACLLLSRYALNCVAGFDPAFEPFYYDDTDLCRRLKAGGFEIFVNPKMTATHIENATTREYLGESGFYSMVKEHRELFLRRWLKNMGEGAYINPRLERQGALSTASAPERPDRDQVALVYTPFNIRPGGGERYLLAAARALSRDYRVVLCSKEVFSRARVLHVLAALGIPEFEFDISGGFDEISARGREIAVSFVMGNEIVPPVAPIAAANLFHLQFPFPWRNVGAYNFELLQLYDTIIVNSEFTKKWAAKRIAEVGVHNPPPIVTLYPPIRQIKPRCTSARQPAQGLHLITVGRFFTGGHSKRQDIFLDIVERARQLSTAEITAAILGSIHGDEPSRNYYMQIRLRAESMHGVEMIVDASNQEIASALRNADVYIHCAGFDVLEECSPEAMEHFGMSIVEALTAGCIPIVCGVGGPREIIEQSRCGFCYESVEEAAQLVVALMECSKRKRAVQKLNAAWIEGLVEPAFARNLLQVVSSARSH